jgi:exodeoxyribonuclease V alpha subunit
METQTVGVRDIWREAGVVNDSDWAAAELLVRLAKRSGLLASDPSEAVWQGMVLALGATRSQNSCVDLAAPWAPDHDTEAAAAVVFPDSADWCAELLACPALVATPETAGSVPRAPFVLDGHRLYANRTWDQECSVALGLKGRAADRLTVVVGGPGTGKTTRVAQELVKRFGEASGNPPRVALAAPTGKAAKRMDEAMHKALEKVNAPQKLRDAVGAAPKQTIHRLLGYRPGGDSRRWTFNAGNPLPVDLVIVDEASMLSLTLVHRLLDALPAGAELHLVGDPDQLASVDAGTVLADLVNGAQEEGAPLHAALVWQTKQWRFRSDSRIALVADAIRRGDADAAVAALSGKDDELEWIDPSRDPNGVNRVLERVSGHAAGIRDAASAGDFARAVDARGELLVLCAHRNGRDSVAWWNQQVERRLGVSAGATWYPGRPVMVVANDPATGLFNGDVGIVCQTQTGGALAVFDRDDPAMRFPVTRLPDIETVHALTIHKSQGSEVDHAVVVLPSRGSKILTRELLYTGVTRARKRLTVVATEDAVRRSVQTPIRRATGLVDRLR